MFKWQKRKKKHLAPFFYHEGFFLYRIYKGSFGNDVTLQISAWGWDNITALHHFSCVQISMHVYSNKG